VFSINKKDFRMTDIMTNATVIYTDGIREQFEAIRMMEKGAIIGRIIDGEFLDCGFISKRNIKEIRDGGN